MWVRYCRYPTNRHNPASQLPHRRAQAKMESHPALLANLFFYQCCSPATVFESASLNRAQIYALPQMTTFLSPSNLAILPIPLGKQMLVQWEYRADVSACLEFCRESKQAILRCHAS